MLKMLGVLLLVVLVWCQHVAAQDRGFGLGVLIGEPTGISAKFWLDRTTAIDVAAAWSVTGGGNLHLHADYLWHLFQLFPVPKGRLPLYVGVGGKLKVSDNNSTFGIRVPVGLAYFVPGIFMDIFVEIAPVINVVPDTGFDLTGGVGVRYFFR